jgi:hypothetical protein
LIGSTGLKAEGAGEWLAVAGRRNWNKLFELLPLLHGSLGLWRKLLLSEVM